jgi:peptidoglycan/xylan/chitin deacetylase (PgdA/CDA1 family)
LAQRKAWHRSWPVDRTIRLLYQCGFLHLVGLCRRWFGRKRLIVLLYHRLSPAAGDTAIAGLEFDDPVPVDRFERHLRILRWFGEPLSLDRACERLRDSNDRARTLISVTFDDGYRDNYTLGRPVWRRHGVPVTLFPAIAPIASGEWLWWDELQQIVGNAKLDEGPVQRVLEVIDEIAPGSNWNGDLKSDDAREQFARFLFARFIDLPADLRDAILHELVGQLGTSRPSRPAQTRAETGDSPPAERLYMNWNELATIADEGVEIGGHTINHPRLPREELAVAATEIGGCRDTLQNSLQRQVTSFAFPGGFYETRELNLVREAGYRVAVTVEKGVNYPDTDPLRLRRIALSWDEPHHLAFKLAFADWLFAPARRD